MKSAADKIKTCWKKIFENIITLNNEYKTAILLTYYSKSGQLFFGPSHVKDKMKKTYNCRCPCTCDEDDISWEKAFIKDNLDLINGVQEMENDPLGNEDLYSYILILNYFILGRDDIVARIQADETIVARLPCKLDLMNYRQLSEWIRNQIILNHTERGQTGSKIGYGEDLWHPDFWIDDVFPWSAMRCNFNNMKANQYTGEHNFVWFMKEVIRKRLAMKRIMDPDDHISMEFSEEEVARKERRS